MQQSASNFSSHNSSISAKSYLYIWLINKQFFFRKTYEEQKQFTTSIIYNKDRYEIELTAKYTHENYISSSSITYCDIKFLKRNGFEITHVDGFTHQERSLSNCIAEYNKLVNKELNMSFIFKIKSKYAFYHLSNVFTDVIKYINFDNNRYEIKIQHENPLITCYYYCFVRFYLETSSMLRQYNLQRKTLTENVKYYLSGSSSWFGSLLETVLSPFTYDFDKNNEMDVVINLPFLGDDEVEIFNNKIQLENVYDDFHNTVSTQLSDYIFNKYSIKPLYLNINDNTSYVDNRVNIYCNPFNVLYYHLCIVNTYLLDRKKELVENKYHITYGKLNMLLHDKGVYLDNFTKCNNNSDNISTDLLINIATIRYFYEYFDVDTILDEHNNNYEYELIDCEELIKLFNKIDLTLSYDYESFETKIRYMVKEITDLGIFEYASYEKYKSVYLFEVIIEQLKSYSKSGNLVAKLLSIYVNYKNLNNDNINELIYDCLTEASRIIVEVEDDFLPPIKLMEYIDELEQKYIEDNYTITEITLLYHKILAVLKAFEFNVEYKEFMLQANIADEIAIETNSDDEIVIDNALTQSDSSSSDTFEHINETDIDTALNNNTLNNNVQKNKKYYISSWLGL